LYVSTGVCNTQQYTLQFLLGNHDHTSSAAT
jgi:hypothetical protein